MLIREKFEIEVFLKTIISNNDKIKIKFIQKLHKSPLQQVTEVLMSKISIVPSLHDSLQPLIVICLSFSLESIFLK